MIIAVLLTAISVSLFGQKLEVAKSGTVNLIRSTKNSHESLKWVIYSE